MKDVHSNLEPSTYKEPDGLVRRSVCKYSGMCAGEGCSDVYEEVFVKGTEPKVCDKHTKVRICAETGQLASEWCQSAVEEYRNLMPDTEAGGKWQTTYSDGAGIPTDVCPHTASDYEYDD